MSLKHLVDEREITNSFLSPQVAVLAMRCKKGFLWLIPVTVAIQSNLYQRSPRQNGHLCIAATLNSSQRIYWYNHSPQSGLLLSAASGHAYSTYLGSCSQRPPQASAHNECLWQLSRHVSCVCLSPPPSSHHHPHIVSLAGVKTSLNLRGPRKPLSDYTFSHCVGVFSQMQSSLYKRPLELLDKGQRYTLTAMDRTSWEQPPLHSSHHFLPPKVTVVDRFDCILTWV